MNKNKVLLVLRRINPKLKNQIGGVVCSSENLLRVAEEIGLNYEIVDTNKSIYLSKVTAAISIPVKIMIAMTRCSSIALNLNYMELILTAPIIIIGNFFFRRRISLRVFGGDLDELYNKNFVFKLILNFVMKNVDVLFLQTNYLLEKFDKFNPLHLPTCRFREKEFKDKIFSNKFVFVGQLKETKGVSLILEAMKGLCGPKVHFYGPLEDYTENDLNTENTKYMGILRKDEVVSAIAEYDVLVLPTFYEGEGYPGTILESFSVGVPVIASRWRSIPEIVENEKTGVLIEPKNIDSLKCAIEKINDDLFQNMRKSSYDRFSDFDCNNIYKEYLKVAQGDC